MWTGSSSLNSDGSVSFRRVPSGSANVRQPTNRRDLSKRLSRGQKDPTPSFVFAQYGTPPCQQDHRAAAGLEHSIKNQLVKIRQPVASYQRHANNNREQVNPSGRLRRSPWKNHGYQTSLAHDSHALGDILERAVEEKGSLRSTAGNTPYCFRSQETSSLYIQRNNNAVLKCGTPAFDQSVSTIPLYQYEKISKVEQAYIDSIHRLAVEEAMATTPEDYEIVNQKRLESELLRAQFHSFIRAAQVSSPDQSFSDSDESETLPVPRRLFGIQQLQPLKSCLVQKNQKPKKHRVSWDTEETTPAQSGIIINPRYRRRRSKKITMGVLKRWNLKNPGKLIQFMEGASLKQLREIFHTTSTFVIRMRTNRELQEILRLLKEGRFHQNPAFQGSGVRRIKASSGRKIDKERMLQNLLRVPKSD